MPVSLVSRLHAPLAAIAMALHSIVAILLNVTILLAQHVGIRLAVDQVQLVHHLNGNARYAVLSFSQLKQTCQLFQVFISINFRLI